MKKCLILLCFTGLWLLTSCHVIINPITDMVVRDSSGYIITNNSGQFVFGQLLVNDSYTASFTIENHGLKDLELTSTPPILISGIDENSFSIVKAPQKIIKPDQSTKFTIKFTPSKINTLTATVTIENSDEKTNPYTFTVLGCGILPAMQVKQGQTEIPSGSGSFDFGESIIWNKSPSIEFTIENHGHGNLYLTGMSKIQIYGTDSLMFAIDQTTTDDEIAPGSITTFKIMFEPRTLGNKSATISIENNDINNNPFLFTVLGTGIASPEINVQDSQANNIPNISGIFDFGNQLNNSPDSETFVIQNLGNDDLILDGDPKVEISSSEPDVFKVVSMPTSPISPRFSSTFTIEFLPTSIQTYSATVLIANDDLDENPYEFTIIGKGVEPEINVIDPEKINIICGSGSYDFGIVKVGESSQALTFTIENLGPGELILSDNPIVKISGTDSSMFLIDETATNANIEPSYSTTFTITFSPTDIGNRTSTISISNNDSDENPFIFTVTGYGSEYGWTKQFGGSLTEWAIDVTTDSNGNIYITGCFEGSVNFAADFGSSDTKTSIGRRDAFITRINSNNTYAWTKCFGGSWDEYGNAVVTDSAGNVYLTGTFYNDTVDFGKDFGVTDIKTSSGSNDIFITKITSNGSYVWTKQIGGSSAESATSIETDSADNIFVTGGFHKTVNFGYDFGVTDVKTALNDNSPDAYVLKINANGSYGWTKQFVGSSEVYGRSVTNDSIGNIYVVGSFKQSVNFGSDFGVSDFKNSNGNSDTFVTKINSNGTYAWTKQFGGSSIDVGQSIAVDSSGNVYVSGMFKETVNFAADFGSTDSKTCQGYYDIFVTKINANLTYGWTRVFGSTGYDSTPESGLLLLSGNVYITGSYDIRADFGTDFGTTDVKVSKGEYDAYIVKMTDTGNYCWTKNIGGLLDDGAHAITNDPSGNIYVVGGFNDTVDFGADFGVSDSKTSAGGYDCFITKILQ